MITAEKDWSGKLVFDAERHKTILNLPIDYPRINQFPEWFTAKIGANYFVVSSQKSLSQKYSGEELLKGITINLKSGEKFVVAVQ